MLFIFCDRVKYAGKVVKRWKSQKSVEEPPKSGETVCAHVTRLGQFKPFRDMAGEQ